MKLQNIKKIAKDNEYTLTEKDGIYYLNKTALKLTTNDENGNTIKISDIEKFPRKANTKAIIDAVDAEMEDLGEIDYINWQRMNDELFSIIDIETTGTSLDKGAMVIELAAIKIRPEGDSFVVVDEFSKLINPGIKIPQNIVKLTTITDEMVKDAPQVEDVIQEYFRFISGTTVVGHNVINFDWGRFLLPLFKSAGINLTAYPIIDTLHIDKRLYPEEKKHGLEALCTRYGVSDENHHRAIADVHMNAEGFIHLRNESKHFWENKPKMRWGKAPDNLVIDYKVSKINPWQLKSPTGIIRQDRLYIDFSINEFNGTCWYDKIKNIWKVKEYSGNIIPDFKKIQALIPSELFDK